MERINIEINSRDRNGLVRDITYQTAKLGITIKYHKAVTYKSKKNQPMSKLIMTVESDSKSQINTLIHNLKKIPGVVSLKSLMLSE